MNRQKSSQSDSIPGGSRGLHSGWYIPYPSDTLPYPLPGVACPLGTGGALFSRRELVPDRGTLPSVERMTITSENITFPQLRWRSVNILQLALTKLAQIGEDQTGMEEASIDNIANFVQYEKLEYTAPPWC